MQTKDEDRSGLDLQDQLGIIKRSFWELKNRIQENSKQINAKKVGSASTISDQEQSQLRDQLQTLQAKHRELTGVLEQKNLEIESINAENKVLIDQLKSRS